MRDVDEDGYCNHVMAWRMDRHVYRYGLFIEFINRTTRLCDSLILDQYWYSVFPEYNIQVLQCKFVVEPIDLQATTNLVCINIEGK